MDAFRGHYDDLNAEDKVMDKAFKREFNDVTAVQQDQLYRLFRKRPRSVALCSQIITPLIKVNVYQVF